MWFVKTVKCTYGSYASGPSVIIEMDGFSELGTQGAITLEKAEALSEELLTRAKKMSFWSRQKESARTTETIIDREGKEPYTKKTTTVVKEGSK